MTYILITIGIIAGCILYYLLLRMLTFEYGDFIETTIDNIRAKYSKRTRSLKSKLCNGNYIAKKRNIGQSRFIILYKKNDLFSFLRPWKEYKNGEYSDFNKKCANIFVKKVNKK